MKKLPMNNPMKPNHKSTIFTTLSCVGIIGTAVTTFIATRKSKKILDDKELSKSEKVKKSFPYFIVPGIVGLGSMAFSISSNISNKHQIKELVSYAGMLGSTLTGYRKEVIDRYGEEVDEEIFNTIRQDSDFHQWNVDTPDKMVRWHDWTTDTWFEKYEREVADAEYHLNRNFSYAGSQSVNQWANMLGVEEQPIWENVGWETTSGIWWVDFEHIKMKDEHGEYYEIAPTFAPDELTDEWPMNKPEI